MAGLPIGVPRAVRAYAIRAARHVEYARLVAVRNLDRIFQGHSPGPIVGRHRIGRNTVHVPFGDQVRVPRIGSMIGDRASTTARP